MACPKCHAYVGQHCFSITEQLHRHQNVPVEKVHYERRTRYLAEDPMKTAQQSFL